MDCVDGGPPPEELLTAWACERWNVLPETGAYYDQDYQLMTRMARLSNIYNAVSRMRNLPGKEIHSLTDGERKILGFLTKLGLLFHG